MYSKTAHSEMKKKSKNQRDKSSTRGKLSQNSSKEAEMKSRDRTRSHHRNRNHDEVHKSKHLSKEMRENVSNPSGKKSSSRSKHKAEVFVKEITINNPRIKYDEHLENAHKMKKHRSRSSENFNRSPKVKPEHLRREKTIHVEKMRKSSQSKPDSRNMKFVKEKKHDEKEIKRHRHKSSGEKKSNRIEDDGKQLLYCQVETNSPFRKITTNNTLPGHSQKEKARKEVKNENRTYENISKKISSAQVHHKKNRPKLVVGRKPFKYSIHEPSSSSDNKKNRKHHKKERNTQRDSQVKKKKKQPPAESRSKNITTAQPQLQYKIEDDLKSYFIRIQSLIDKKIDALLQNYKSKVKLKEGSDGETIKPTTEGDNGMNRHRHRSKSRKKESRKCSNKERHEAKPHSVERMERRFNSPVKRNYDFCGAPTRHSSPLKQKYSVSPRLCSPSRRNHEEMQRRPSTPPRHEETPPIIKRKENRHNSSDQRNIKSPQHHNSPVDRCETYHRRSSSSGRNRETPHHQSSPVGGYHETSRLPSHPGRNSESFRQHNSVFDGVVGVPHCHNSIRDVKEKKHTSSKKVPNYSSASVVCVKEHEEKDNNVDRYVELRASGSILPSKHIENKIKKIKPEKESNFRVEGIEPAKLLESGNKAQKTRPISGNLECKIVSIIGIPSQMKKHAFRNVEVLEDFVERKKKTKRFKLYYQYSRDLNCFDPPDSGNSSEGKSVVSDSLRIISDDSESHIELCKMKKEILKQSGPAEHYAALKTTQKLSDQSCIFSTEGNITNREPGKYRHKPPVNLKLNNIIEEKTSVASSGEQRKFNLEIDCKYLKSLHSSSSDYGVRSRNKCDVLFQNEMIVSKREQAVPIKSRAVTHDSTKPKRKRGLANVASRKMHNTKQKRKEQKVKLFSKSDVDISYNSLINIKSSSSSASQKYASPKCSRLAKTVNGPNSRDFFPNVANARVYNESQTSLNWWKTDKQKDEMKQYLQNQQQIYFGIGTRLPQNYSPMEAFDEIDLDKAFLDKSTGFGEVNKKSSINANKNDEHSSSLLRKIYYLIENQNRERSDAAKDVKINFRQEKEVQAVCNKQDEEISTKDLPSQSDDFGNQYSAEENDEKNKKKLDVSDVIAQKISARDVGTDMDKFRFRNSETDAMSQKIDVGKEVRKSDTEKHSKCLSATQISKTGIAVEVDITNKPPREKLVDNRHKNKDSNVECNVKRPLVPKKSAINHFSKSNEGNRSKSVLPKKKRDKPEMKKEQSMVRKDTRNYHTHEKPSSAKASTLEHKEEVPKSRNSIRSDSKSTVKSKIPTSKKRIPNAPVDKKSKTEEKPCTQLCDEFNECSNLKESQSEISFRDITVDAEESKITSLVCLHNFINVIKYETSSKSNSHSLDQYPNSEQQERSRLFLTKEYKNPEFSAYKKRKHYDDCMRRRRRRKAGIRGKNDLAPQVYEVRFLTVDNLHSSLVKNKNTTEKNDLIKTSYDNALASTPPECGYKSNPPKCFFEGSFNKINFTKSTHSNLCEFYQKIVDRQGSCLAYEKSNKIINEGNFQGNYDHRLPGQKDVGNFLDCICKHLISNKLADSFPEIDESFKKAWSVYQNMNLKGEDPPSKTTLRTEDEKTVESADVSKKDIIADIISSDEDPVPNINIDQDNGGLVEDTEYLHDKKLVVTGNLSCPILRAPDSSFDFLYQTGSSEKLSNVGTFVSPIKPVNNILGFALNGNTSHKPLKTLIKKSLRELDLEAPCSVESGYSSTKSKNNLSITNFFKKPKIAALMEPQNDNWFCSDENIHLQEAISFTPGFTDYKKMTKQCQEYAQKVTNYSKTKISMDEVYEEIPLEKLLGKRNSPNLMKFRSDSSIFEKKIEAERKESVQSDATNSIPSGKRRYIHENFDHNTDFHQYELILPSGDHIHNNHQVSVIYENMAGIHTGRVKGNDTAADTVHKNQLMESESIENVELIKPESNTDIKMLKKILDSHIVLSSTNLNTQCITIVESQNLGENDDCKNALLGNENAGDSFKQGEDECNETEKHLSNCNLLDYENSWKFKSIICKKFFENLLEVYEKEIAVSSALLQDNDFLENELLSFRSGNCESQTASKKKLTVKNRIKRFIKKVFGSRNREETEKVSNHETERLENVLTPVDADYQEKLQSLAGGAHKYFSMFVQAVEHNQEINDEIKICGLCKLLQRIENGYFRFLRGVEKVNFEEELKNQIKKAFMEIHCKASAEAKMMHRKLSSNDIHMIATFVCKYRIGLLSRTDIIASYIGQGFLRTDQQLKAAVISLMKRPEIDLQEYLL